MFDIISIFLSRFAYVAQMNFRKISLTHNFVNVGYVFLVLLEL